MKEPTAERLDDGLLVREAKADACAFGAIFDRYFEAVYRFAFHNCGRDAALASDVTQEAFLRAFRALPRYEERGRPLLAWLYRIAMNAARDQARRPKRLLEAEEPQAPEVPTPSPLAALLDRLPELQRHVVILKIEGGHTAREIAEIIDRTEGAVKALYARALRNLRKWAQKEGIGK